MTRKKGKIHRFRRRMYHARRRHDKRMPMSVGIGLAASVLASPAPGWSSVIDAVKAGNMSGAVSSFIRSWTGIYGIDGNEPVGINLMDALNPLNMNDAPAWKATFWSAIIARGVKSIIHVDPLSRVPIVNKYFKFS